MDRGIRSDESLAGVVPSEGRALRRRRSNAMEERLVRWIFASCALVSVVTTVGIVVLLLNQSVGFFQEVSLWEFITGTRWSPILKPNSYGVLPLVCGTLLVAILAAAVSRWSGSTCWQCRLPAQLSATNTSEANFHWPDRFCQRETD